MQHIIIVGSNGVGKSTLINALLKEIPVPIDGVITKKEAPRADGFSPVYIHPYGVPRTFSEENCIGLCRAGRSVAHPEAFDRYAKTMRLRMDGVIVLDELGFLETNATEFTAAVLALMDRAPLVIAAVRDKDTPFLHAVRTHPRADVYRIDPDNREKLRETLIGLLPSYLNGAFSSSSGD